MFIMCFVYIHEFEDRTIYVIYVGKNLGYPAAGVSANPNSSWKRKLPEGVVGNCRASGWYDKDAFSNSCLSCEV